MKIRTAFRLFAVFCLFIVIARPFLKTFAKATSLFDPANLEFELITSGLNQPLLITNAGDGTGRLFVLERAGYVRIIRNGSLLPIPFLEIHSLANSTASEQGLLALAFHPSYATNGQFYIVYTDTSGSLILSRFTRSSGDPDRADPGSRVTLLSISHPTYQNHNGGTLAFGPDGYLYWSTGDGGGGGDPSNHAQDLSSLLGKILRLNVDAGSLYSVPPSNPFFNNPNPSIRKEIWAYGLRNPWRFSFDRQTGDMYIGDVGQQAREEIDFQPANDAGGKNYGWRVMEGSLCYNPSSGCDQSGKVLPIAEYDHSIGCSITGGYVYRGGQYAALQGYYFYGDFCTGILFSLRNNPPNGWTAVQQVADTPYSISSFGEGENGELYLVDYGGGRIFQFRYIPDTTAPVVSSILRASGNPSSASNVYFSVHFSEPVTGVSASDFSLVAGGISGATIGSVGGSGNIYAVMVNTGTGGGTLRLDVRATASIADLSGNPLGNAPFTAGETYNINSGGRFDITLNRMGDFNGDGKAEVAIFRPSEGRWYISSIGSFQFGEAGDIPVQADYNGDGKDDIAVFRPSEGRWYVYGIGDFRFGEAGDIPVVGDYNGDGKDDIAVFRASNSTWYVYGIGNYLFGTVGDIPVVGDYNGDAKDDIAVFRPSEGRWYVYGIGDFRFGESGDTPVAGDYNGDGRADIAVFRASNSTWYVYGIGNFLFGTVGDTPVVGDYNGDARDDIAVFSASKSTWSIYGIGNFLYGTVGDIPI